MLHPEEEWQMANLEGKKLDAPDETRSFDKGKLDVVNLTGADYQTAQLRTELEVVRLRQADRRHRQLPDAPHGLRRLGSHQHRHGRRHRARVRT
jgi:hypothetical protein